MAVTLRGTSKATTTGGTATVPLPAGTAVNDMLVMTFASSFAPGTPPSGWTRIEQREGNFLNGATYYKIATSADITAGSATANTGGSHQATAFCYAFVGHGGAAPTVKFSSRQGATSVAAGSIAPTSALTIAADSMCAYSGHLRFASAPSVPTVDRGTLRDTAIVGTIGSEAGYTEAFAATASGVNPTLTYPACQGIYYVVVEVAGPVTGNSGSLAATLPPLSANLSGTSARPPTSGVLAAVLPRLTATISGEVVRHGLGLNLAATTSAITVAPTSTDTALVPLHVVTPTVPAPTLVNGRPA